MLSKIKKSFRFAVFACSLWLVVVCAASITLFGDDYGYVRYLEGGAFFARMAEHFETVNGRTLLHALDVLLLQAGGIPGKIVIAVCIAALWRGAACVAAPADDVGKRFRAKSAFAALFWLIGLPALREGVFWITGAMNYLVPTTLTVWQIAAAKRYRETGKALPGFCVLAVITAAATELSAAVSVAVTAAVLVLACRRREKRHAAILTGILFLSLAAAATVIFAPGNALRASFYPEFYAQPFFARAAAHYAEFSAVCLSDTGILPALTVLCCAVFARCVREKRYALAAAAAVPALAAVLADGAGLFGLETAALASLPVLAAAVTVLVILLTDLRRNGLETALLLAALAVQAAMLASPVFGPRTTLLSSVLLLIAAVRILAADGISPSFGISLAVALPVLLPMRMTLSLPVVGIVLLVALAVRLIRRRGAGTLLASLLAIVILLGGAAAARGYFRNWLVYRENDRRIEAYLDDPEGDLALLTPPVGACRYIYPSDGSAWHDEQFRLWRGIPAGTAIRFDGGGD